VSQENVEIVRRVIGVEFDLTRRVFDPDVYGDLMAPDVEIDMSRRVFNPEVYRGVEGWARLQDELRKVWEEWRMTPERFIDAGDRVVSIERVRGRGRGSGVELDIRSATIWTLLDGRVTRVEGALDPEEALKAVALEQ
jgi:ketosteroid isomerase-like protein